MAERARILVVEPELRVRGALVTAAYAAGHRVEAVCTERAMRQALERRCDIVLIDAHAGLAGYDGLALAECAASHGAAIIVIADASHDQRALEQAGYLTLSSSFRSEDVIRLIDQALRRQPTKSLA